MSKLKNARKRKRSDSSEEVSPAELERDRRETIALGASAPRAERNHEVILAPKGQTASELVVAAGDSVPALASAMGIIARRFEESVQGTHRLNLAVAEFREKAVQQVTEEIKSLRYGIGNKVGQTTDDLAAIVTNLQATVALMIQAQGMSGRRVKELTEKLREQVQAPRAAEFAAYREQVEELIKHAAAVEARNRVLEAENKRLEEDLEAERLRLAGCGVAAMANTPESVANRIGTDSPYYSASYLEVCRAVDREMALREELASAQAVVRQAALDTFGREMTVAEFAEASSCEH